MRHKGSISEVKVRRNQYLVRMFKEVIEESDHPLTSQQIWEEMADRPVDRFFLSWERGREIYRYWTKRFELPRAEKWALRMYINYIEECDRLIAGGMKPRAATYEAIYHKACCIGLSPYRICEIVREERRKKTKDKP